MLWTNATVLCSLSFNPLVVLILPLVLVPALILLFVLALDASKHIVAKVCALLDLKVCCTHDELKDLARLFEHMWHVGLCHFVAVRCYMGR